MQPDVDAVLLAHRAHRRHPLLVERGDIVGVVVELDVEVLDVVLRRPHDAVLDADVAGQIDTNTVT
jgi:hypothetical protein